VDPERSADPPNRAGAALPRFTVPLLPRCLIEERSFQRVYIVPPFSVNEARRRELGSQHRDALYAVFRGRANGLEIPSPQYEHNVNLDWRRSPRPAKAIYETGCTWRGSVLPHPAAGHFVQDVSEGALDAFCPFTQDLLADL